MRCLGEACYVGFYVVIAACLVISGCATDQGPPPPQPVARVQCLPMASYTPSEQRQAADELGKLPPGAMLGRFVTDYGALRAANRACQATH